MTENEISRIIYESSIEVHREVGGPGLLESVYEEALCHELGLRGLRVERQEARSYYLQRKRTLNTTANRYSRWWKSNY